MTKVPAEERAETSTAVLEALADALTSPRPDAEHAHSGLRDAVRLYALGARSGNVPPQQLLLRLKELFRSTASAATSSRRIEVLLDRAITWAIHDYHHGDAGARRGRR